ncbi:uncharacterized protein LOC125684328 isoform X2 [Lagopus muta]|uniref:uncharacterized protein LOC125684328 isoform X1 n=1 Tax=Lagopus muta TaxID=64668 RepID=UPI00209F2DED|nr:uncharacterized protein LOC125684328 isoform X1 [Lagopus muta]XP_048782397.1 uncharacterized protein LOC125684328 isoform X2 [Lagopus muta]
MAGKKYGESNAQHCEGKPGKSSSKKQENPDEFREEQESGKAALATLWRREPLRLPFGPCLSPTCQQSSQVLSVKYQSGVLLLSLGWMPEKEAWRIGEYPQRLCHVLKEMVEEKAAQGPERQKETWRIAEYPQRLCHVLKKMVKEKAAQGGCLCVCSLKDWGSGVSR